MSNMTPEQARQFYGCDALAWLLRWDAGESVWSIEMGGLGPGYEQCIQITTAEVVRFLLKRQPRVGEMDDPEKWKALQHEVDESLWKNPVVNALRLSGAQAGAAKSLGWQLYRQGPAPIMLDDELKERHIQVSRNFPSVQA